MTLFQINFYVPESHLEAVKNALFAKGAGRIGNYAACCWQTLGQGQFMPLASHHAFIGTTNVLEKIPEYKVEMIVQETDLAACIQAFKEHHPYEEPAYQIIRLQTAP